MAISTWGAVSGWSSARGLTGTAGAESPPLVGFSFSPISAAYHGDDPSDALAQLLNALVPDLVRLPVFWDRVEARSGAFDYRELDGLLGTVAAHNRLVPAHPARVVLIVGARNIGYPEVHVPEWLGLRPGEALARVVADPAYGTYIQRTVARYAGNELLAAWQVENEALDDVRSPLAASTDIPVEDIQEDVATVHHLDAGTPVIVTTYNNSTLSLDMEGLSAARARRIDTSGATPVGHPQPTIPLADILGMDAYVATGSTSLSDADATKRIGWKAASLAYWAEEARSAGKPLWITEMQGEAWLGRSTFRPADLVTSARAYRRVGAAGVLLWGVEGWLHDPAWMAAGLKARGLLGSQSSSGG